MKKLFITLLFLVFLPSCILMSDAYYETEKAMWDAKNGEAEAWANRKPDVIASIQMPDGGPLITINNQNVPQPIVIHGEPNAFVEVTKSVVGSTFAEILAGGFMLDKVLGNFDGGSYSSGGDMTVTKDSNNPNSLTSTTADSGSHITQQDFTDSGNTDSNDINSSYNPVDDHSAVSEPTVVNPVVVNPEIVNPVVVNPEIVTVPATIN